MVDGVEGMEGVAGGELCGGRRLQESWGFALQWFPSEFEVLGGSARSRGRGWWYWLDGGGSGCDEQSRRVAAAELAEGEEGSFPLSMAG